MNQSTIPNEQAEQFAQLALAGIDREYPNKPANVMAGPEAVLSPRQMHPAFFGCFDWHSAVHSHWLLVRLLKLHPDLPCIEEIRQALAAHFTEDNLFAEADHFRAPEHAAFERMYGWAWLLRLAAELHECDDAESLKWRKLLLPLENVIVHLISEYLPKLSYPIRTGQHPDTGFALGQIIDYAAATGNQLLADLAIEKATTFYLQDRDYPFGYEPSGHDFFSSGLNTADLMRRVLGGQEYSDWLAAFLSDLSDLKPVPVTDVTDGKLVHLAGLNLSRAWCLHGIASALPDGDSRVADLTQLANDHAAIGDQHVISGHYEGEHWLATFSVYCHSRVGIAK